MTEKDLEIIEKARTRIKELLAKNADDIEKANLKKEEILAKIDRVENAMKEATMAGDLKGYSKAKKTYNDSIEELEVLSNYVNSLESKCLVDPEEKTAVFQALTDIITQEQNRAQEHIKGTLAELEKYVDGYVEDMRLLGMIRQYWTKNVVRSELHFDNFQNMDRKSTLREFYYKSMNERIPID